MGTFQRQPATSSQIMAQVINEDKLQLQYVQNRYDLTEHKKIVTQLLTFFSATLFVWLRLHSHFIWRTWKPINSFSQKQHTQNANSSRKNNN